MSGHKREPLCRKVGRLGRKAMCGCRSARSLGSLIALAVLGALVVGAQPDGQARAAGDDGATPAQAAPSRPAQSRVQSGTVQSGAALSRAELERHVRFLASDELAGRDTGSEGAVRASEYLANELEQAGFEPAGDDGTYFQIVPLERVAHTGAPVFEARSVAGETLTGDYGSDFRLRTDVPLEGSYEVRVVRGREDLPAEPRPDVALFFDARRSHAAGWLDAAGQRDGEGWGLLLFGSSDREGRAVSPPAPRLRAPAQPPARPAQVTLRGPWLDAFRSGNITQVRLNAHLRIEPVRAVNVVAKLPGRAASPSSLEESVAHEALLLSAHYDHLGERAPEPGRVRGPGELDEDLVYNGADDNASGVAFVLELAEALAERGMARTVLVLLVTGEERGLLGTRHYLNHPAHPLDDTVCNLNFEMVGRPDALAGGTGWLWMTGWERSNLGEAFGAQGLQIAPDERLDQGFFQRSDNYPFALRGVVAQTLSSYDLHSDYHRVTDEIELLDFDHMHSAALTSLQAVRRIAEGSLRPGWLPGGRPE